MLSLAILLAAAPVDPEVDAVLAVAREWDSCVMQSIDQIAGQTEGADILAEAALGMCQRYAGRFSNAVRVIAGDEPTTMAFVDKQTRTLRQKAIARVVQSRMKTKP